MKSAAAVKNSLKRLGADLCGIAPVDRFRDAPEGFHPADIYPDTHSVIVFARRLPASAFLSASPVPYTWLSDEVLSDVFRITLRFCEALESSGVKAVPIPSEPYEYRDEAAMEGRGILSLKHAGMLAGIGVLGHNTLLYNREFGNMIILGAVCSDREYTGDPIDTFTLPCSQCGICEAGCPVQAIDGAGVRQNRCRPHSNVITKRGYMLYNCSRCRTGCPWSQGVK